MADQAARFRLTVGGGGTPHSDGAAGSGWASGAPGIDAGGSVMSTGGRTGTTTNTGGTTTSTGGTTSATSVPSLAVLAGVPSGVGSADGVGPAARFNSPSGVAVDGAGNLYVSDRGNLTIRKITPGGVATTLAGSAGLSGSEDGAGAAARFGGPSGLVVDGAGNVFVVDTGNLTIRKITPAGVVTTLAGSAGLSGSTDGAGAAARFSIPTGVAVDAGDNVFVADSNNGTIRKITPDGVVSTWAGAAAPSGSADGPGATARFKQPRGVAVDGAGNLFVADWGNSTIRKITPSRVVSTLAGLAGQSGNTDGTGAEARFYHPAAVAADGAGHVFVVDYGNNAIRKITAAGVVTTVVGVAALTSAGNLPGPLPASIVEPVGVAVDSSGTRLTITLRHAVMVAVLSH